MEAVLNIRGKIEYCLVRRAAHLQIGRKVALSHAV